MINLYRKRALVGVSAWLALLLTFVGLIIFLFVNRDNEGLPSHVNEQRIRSMIFWSILPMMGCFFWACYHLATAKGYSRATCFAGVFGPLAQLIVLVILLVIQDRHSREPMRNRSRKRGRQVSMTERIVICRRNALVGNFFGLCGIAAGVFLVLFRTGLFHSHSDEVLLGMFVFLAGYVGVITGCWWWLKAKDWIDAIVFIGLMPLGVLFVPWVRLIFLAVPNLLPISMVFMPLVLLVVVFVLPDKSSWKERKRWRINRGDEDEP